MSDPHAKRWLADDPHFLVSLNDLDRGLAEEGDSGDGEEMDPAVAPPPPVRQPARPAPPVAPRSAAVLPRSTTTWAPTQAVVHVDSGIPARQPSAPAPPVAPPVSLWPVSSPAPVHHAPIETSGDVDEETPAPQLAFARLSTPPDPRVRRPLLDLFPPSALEAGPPTLPALGTAVGPQLPPPRPRRSPEPDADAPSPIGAVTYESFYGLREKPFSLSTDPKFLYQSASHERAAQDLLGAIRKRGGVAVLTGAMGMGKTTLCRSLVDEIDRRTVPSLVLDPVESTDDLLKAMLVDFGVISRDDLAGAPQIARDVLTRTLTSFLESLVPIKAGAVVIIDEAQNLPAEVFGELGSIIAANPQTQALQVVLVGQPALTALLTRPEQRLLNASVTRRSELGPLGADEVSGYVMHRLAAAGSNTRVEFTDAAVARLYSLSEGVPRVINLLCDRALSRGQQSSVGVIDDALVDASAADLDLGAPEAAAGGSIGSLWIAAGFALLVLAGAAGALWVSRDAVNRTMLLWLQVPPEPRSPMLVLPAAIAPIPPPADIPDDLQGPDEDTQAADDLPAGKNSDDGPVGKESREGWGG